MFRLAVLFACLALSHSHAVLPVVPAVHSAPLVLPYPLAHGYAGHGLYGHGLYGHGLLTKPLLSHHLLKRSPHLVAPLHHVAPLAHHVPLAHAVAPVPLAPVAVSHQSRVDVHSSPAVIAPVVPIVKPLVAPIVAAPYVQKALVPATGYYGLGHYGGHYGGHY